MLDIDMIHEEIEKLENCDCTDWNVCKKLAILYTIKNNYKAPAPMKSMVTSMHQATPENNITMPQTQSVGTI